MLTTIDIEEQYIDGYIKLAKEKNAIFFNSIDDIVKKDFVYIKKDLYAYVINVYRRPIIELPLSIKEGLGITNNEFYNYAPCIFYNSEDEFCLNNQPCELVCQFPFNNANVIMKNFNKFAIITGENGIGKTQFLKQIQFYNYEVFRDKMPQKLFDSACSTENLLEFKELVSKNHFYNPIIEDNLWSENFLDQKLYELSCKTGINIWNLTSQDIIEHYNYPLSGNIYDHIESLQKFFNLYHIRDNHLFDKLQDISNTVRKEIKDLSIDDIVKYGDIDKFDSYQVIVNYIQNTIHNYLLDVYNTYIGKLNSIDDNPIDSINNILDKINFGYVIYNNILDNYSNNPLLFHPSGLGRQYRRKLISYEDLSEGQKMIFKLALMTYRLKDSNSLLLLDEPDANLHPALCQVLIDTLTKLTENGLRVIMTSHNPVSIACAPSDCIFVMEDKEKYIPNKLPKFRGFRGNRYEYFEKVGYNKIIRPATSEDAIMQISKGLNSNIYEEVFGFVDKFMNSNKDIIVFVEGSTDVSHIKNAIKVFNDEYANLSNCDIISVETADNYPNLLKFINSSMFKKNYPNKKCIFLSDCDEKGKKCIYIDDNTIKYKKKEGFCEKIKFIDKKPIALLTLQSPDSILEEYCPIEFLYKFDFIRKFEGENNYKLLEPISSTFGIKDRKYNEEQYVFVDSEINKNKESGSTNLVAYHITDKNIEGNKERNKETVKDAFAKFAVKFNEKEVFENFRPTLDVLNRIVELFSKNK